VLLDSATYSKVLIAGTNGNCMLCFSRNNWTFFVFDCNMTQSTLLFFPFVLFFQRIALFLPQPFPLTAQNERCDKDLKRTIITVQWWCINVESVVEWQRME
jgi:hypothetical protein